MTTPFEQPQVGVDPIVSLRDVRLTLESRAGPVEILKGLSLDLEAGQSFAIVGPSGSGKTSMLMIMAGLERATSGNVRVAGHDFAAMGEDELAAARGRDIGIVFQSFHLIPTMTALENVALPLELTGRGQSFEIASARLADVGLADRTEHYPAQLSGGEQQRVALARALAPSPRLLFADEPTGNLDTATGDQIIKLIFDLQAGDRATLVLVTHDESLAARCDQVIRMGDGILEPHQALGGVRETATADDEAAA